VDGDVPGVTTAPRDEAVVVLGSRHPALEVGVEVDPGADRLVSLPK
jgi:hypothetical protein